MTAPSRAEAQISLALDAIQSKRRLERVVEAATALLDRYRDRTADQDRLTTAYELIRRNFTPHVALVHGDLSLGSVPEGGGTVFRTTLTGADGVTGTLHASYTPPGTLGLTAEEWQAAMRLLAGILQLGLAGRAG